MFIGSQTTSTLLDVFRTGLTEVIRATGLPAEVKFNCEYCSIIAKGADMSNRIDMMRIILMAKNAVPQEELDKALTSTRVNGRIKYEEGLIKITLPPFEWRQLPALLPVDALVEHYCKHSLRSQTWELAVESYTDSDFNINVLIEEMKRCKASDLHLRAGNKPFIRVDNELQALEHCPALTAEDMHKFIFQLGGPSEIRLLETERESSFQYHAVGVGYLRCSGYVKQGAMGLAIRLIPEAPSYRSV